ncbi:MULTISPECIES: hypothetical protein [Methylobacterium]|uniref:Uncharacterized protein n=1 Tax=Methylobacterium fujisawaense TaxID=107400 RepID=A0ABR6D9H0_9HYPH|nr:MULTISPECIES: hypothetical protein [Methylobacterium]MBA9062731.1 hypothetical protein [Methylobacterium fujisawaense]MDE4915749.1 hypothetical protein [Methylobacterium sp. 092160098-2]
MCHRLQILIALTLFAFPVQAAGPGRQATGTFERKEDGYEQGVVVKASGASGYVAEFSVGSRGCGGGVTMKGRSTGPRTILFSKTENGQTCRIMARYSPDLRSVALEEDGCLTWHGASCEFQGTLTRKGR